jgi:hypothetical protein
LSGFIKPAFVYDPGGGNVTLIPTYPPINKQPQGSLNAVRHDTITSSGLKQSVTERVESFNNFEFANVPQADLAAWYGFLGYALAGGQFTVYDDSTSLVSGSRYTLEDTSFDPKRNAFQNYSFTLNTRKVLPSFINAASHAEALGNGTTAVVTLTGVSKGNLILAAYSSQNTINPGMTVTDTAGNTYVPWDVANNGGGGGMCIFMFAAIANSSGSLTITASGAGTAFRRMITATQWRGANQDGFAQNTSVAVSLSGSLLPASSGDLLLTVAMANNVLLSQLNIQTGDAWAQVSTVFCADTTGMAAGFTRALPAVAKNVTWVTNQPGLCLGIWGIKF